MSRNLASSRRCQQMSNASSLIGLFSREDDDFHQFSAPTVPLNKICYITKGMVVHADEKRAPGAFKMKDLVSNTRDQRHPKPFVEGKHLERWLPAEKNGWNGERNEHLTCLVGQRSRRSMELMKKYSFSVVLVQIQKLVMMISDCISQKAA